MRKRFIGNYSYRTFSSTATRCICIKSLRKALIGLIKKRPNYQSLIENRGEYKQIFVNTDNHGQNILNKVKKSSETGREQKTLITAFA